MQSNFYDRKMARFGMSITEIIVSTRQVAGFFDVTSRSVIRWAKRGCPRIGHDRWDLKEVFLWWKVKQTCEIQPFVGELETFDASNLVLFEFE